MGGKKGDTDMRYAEAVDYCIAHECLGFQAINLPKFKGLEPRLLSRKVQKKLAEQGASNLVASRDDMKVLTKEEENAIVEWLVACNKVGEGKNRDELGEKICEILKCRKKVYQIAPPAPRVYGRASKGCP
ncbi:hypothetical protein CYMTET_42370 [Cymbomonas tetramitiformis]|uniref:Uncharacterized protein n=1 Tax=Cymbomonas tetramitiformis TaxID=36881 RepID=A0AAE0C488_9CHLO|nr:hypothetical protein CYMTET_42370 [Cymbomonas tetramitiformis]